MPHHHRRKHLLHLKEDTVNAVEARREHDNHHEERDPDVATVISVVYVSMAKTFSGDAVWVTQGQEPSTLVGTPAQTSAAKTSAKATSAAAKSSAAVSSSPSSSTSSDEPESTSDTSSDALSSSTSVPATKLVLATSSIPAATTIASASATATSAASSGMSGGAKAGLAFGILIGIGALLGLVLFAYHRKKKSMQQQKLDDEKKAMQNQDPFTPAPAAAGVAPSIRTARTMSTAPRLSLRPVTQFSPTFENRKSAGNALAMAAIPTANSKAPPSPSGSSLSAWERRGAANAAASGTHDSNPFSDPKNPFSNDAAIEPSSAPPTPAKTDMPTSNHLNDFANPAPAIAAADATPAALAAGAVAAATITRKEVPKSSSPPPQPSPTWTEDIPASPGPAPTGPPPVAVAGSNPNGPAPMPDNVHRVQLDFKPSMQDELELRAGQLVRMLHEYDDGWALCIRMDRSQQGVVPRTCLSKHPVKPRQGPPPNAPRMRGPPMAPGAAPRPLTPNSGRNSPQPFGGQPRPMSPAGGRNSPGPAQQRPMSPAGGRNSPGPYGQPRPMSPAGGRNSPGPYGQGRPMSPAGRQGPRGRAHSNAPFTDHPRSLSPGPYGGLPKPPAPKMGRPRSNSASSVMARRASPPGPSPMNPNANPLANLTAIPRKPVPGQAI